VKKLPPIHGLLREAKLKELQASREADASRSQAKCPRMAHEAGESADRLAKAAGQLREFAAEDVDIITQLEAIITFAGLKTHGSEPRTRAMRKIEEASMILRREIGDAPQVPSAE